MSVIFLKNVGEELVFINLPPIAPTVASLIILCIVKIFKRLIKVWMEFETVKFGDELWHLSVTYEIFSSKSPLHIGCCHNYIELNFAGLLFWRLDISA